MSNFPNVQTSAELKEALTNSVTPSRIRGAEQDLTLSAKLRISEIRAFFKISKTSLATMLGTSYRQYLRFEEGTSTLPSWVLQRIAIFYNLSLDFVSGLSNEPKVLYEGYYENVNGFYFPDEIEKANA